MKLQFSKKILFYFVGILLSFVIVCVIFEQVAGYSLGHGLRMMTFRLSLSDFVFPSYEWEMVPAKFLCNNSEFIDRYAVKVGGSGGG